MADRDRPRGERPGGDRPPGDRGGGRPRDDRPRSSKPGGGFRRPDFRAGGRPTNRPPSDRPGGSRPPGNRPPGSRPPFDRPYQADRDRPEQPGSDRPRFDRPRTDRPSYDRPRPERQFGDRPQASRPYNDRPRPERQFGDRPQASRPYGDRPRPERQFGDRPPSDRPPASRSFGDRPRTDRPQTDRPYGDRPRRPPFDARRPYTSRPAYNDRPQREPQVDRDALVGEGEELIAGRRPVEEAFAARRDAIRLLIVPERRAALDALAIHATTLRIPVVEVEGGTLTALAGFDGHQGVALVARPRPAGDIDAILARAHERGEAPFVLVLDSLEDPQNFGTLLRSAEACGVHGVIYPTRRSAPLSPAAIKASAGATEHLVLAAVDDLAGTLADLHGDGLRIVGADEEASLAYGDADLRGPLAIIVGSEGRGISGPVRRRLDLAVRIPMRGKIGSLNAAVAGSVLLFAAAAQRPESAPPRTAVAEEPKIDLAPEQGSEPEPEQKTDVQDPPPTKKSAASKTAEKSAAVAKKSAAVAKPAPAKKSAAVAKSPAAKKASAKRSGAALQDLLPGDD